MDNYTDTEKNILTAAREIFAEKGHDGARMQEIADRAKINKAMLHYYFRSKEKLFERIFKEAFRDFWPEITRSLLESDNVKEFMKRAIASYVDLFMNKPYLPNFILSEVNRNPDRLEALMKDGGVKPYMIIEYLREQMEKGHLKQMDPGELLVNVISLTVFPFVGRPIVERMIFNNDKKAYNVFLNQRKQTIYMFLESLIIEN